MLLSVLPALIYIGLVCYCVIECLQTPATEVRGLSRPGWIAAILVVPLFGAGAWLISRREGGQRRHQRSPAGPERADGYGWTAEGVAQHPIGPDDDPEFLAGLGRAQRERQRLLTRQEEDRRRREQQRRPDDPTTPDPT